MTLETFSRTLPVLGERTIRVAVPSSPGPWPVLYMPDGQNLFRDEDASYGTSWRVLEALAATRLELLVVGIDSPREGLGRLDELSPWVNTAAKSRFSWIDRDVGGLGDAWCDAVIGLKTFVDGRWPTRSGRDATFVAGSSLGGVISAYAAARHPQVFSRVACFSTALWFSPELEAFVRRAAMPDRVYVDAGTSEGDNEDRWRTVSDAETLVAAYTAAGLDEKRLRLVIEPGGEHNETAWARRLPAALEWLLGDLKTS